VEEFPSPGGRESMPYAIDVTPDGAVWYVETGDDEKNMLVRFNPETKKFLTWPIPGGGGTVRNMDIDKQGNLWLADSGVGKLTPRHDQADVGNTNKTIRKNRRERRDRKEDVGASDGRTASHFASHSVRPEKRRCALTLTGGRGDLRTRTSTIPNYERPVSGCAGG